MTENEDTQAELIAEKLKHMIDLLKAELETLERERRHDREIYDRRLALLDEQARDHENRIRSLQDSATTFKVWSGLASGGSSIMAIIALVKTWLFG